jgi:chemotaxis protein methyltransferase CheR
VPVSPPEAGYKRPPVHISEFFRTPGQFERLATAILPKLLAQRPALRVWSAGCSYGPEPYSIALLLELLAPRQPHVILATDIDELALARAAAANSFSERDVLHVPPQLRRWFRLQAQTHRFALDEPIRSRVRFLRHDLLSAPFVIPGEDRNPARQSGAGSGYDPSFDLIVCRNVMMYFTGQAKADLLQSLHRALRPGGYLFVGDAEVVNDGIPAAGFVQELVGFYRKGVRDEEPGVIQHPAPAQDSQ